MAVQQQALYSRQSEAYVSQPTEVETRLIQYQGWTNIVTSFPQFGRLRRLDFSNLVSAFSSGSGSGSGTEASAVSSCVGEGGLLTRCCLLRL